MCCVKRKRNVLNVKQKLEILQKLDNGESASTDAGDVLNEGNTIYHSAALQSVETLLHYMGQRGFDYGDISGGLARLPACPMAGGSHTHKSMWAPRMEQISCAFSKENSE
ncbi:hypothetical protein AVEN_107790-1 [Araneus ventricosus]|uniref:HTH psq-type domain-containing protein n=1 Tax=Araneus ventricosus TaxID=182803 RepID=A0A4Y2I3E4_ARAVE|nr:hypothetical protein AVEN_107790-1 [Araneus ventricosus]